MPEEAKKIESLAPEHNPVLAIGHDQVDGPSPALGVLLAVLVGAAVFAFIWKIRKTFGMKE